MNIAIVTHTLRRGDGQGRVNYEIALSALDRGHRVTLIATSVDPSLMAREGAAWVPISVDGWPTALIRNQVFAWRSARWLRRHRAACDVVLANGFITWAAADVNAAHFVHTAWLQSRVHTARLTTGPESWYQWLYTALNARWERQAFRNASTIVAVSDRVRTELVDAGVDSASIRVIPNGVDLKEFSPGPADRESLGLRPNVPLALFLGDLRTPRKNLDTVLKTLLLVPSLHLAVAGQVNGSHYPALATDLGVADRVSFLDFRSDVPALFRASDVCICPSRYEPFSLVVLEALASGCPVVTAACVGASPLVQDSCGVVVADPDDVASLACAVEHVLGADTTMMRAAARSVAEQYSWDRTAAAYLDVFERQYAPVLQSRSLVSPSSSV